MTVEPDDHELVMELLRHRTFNRTSNQGRTQLARVDDQHASGSRLSRRIGWLAHRNWTNDYWLEVPNAVIEGGEQLAPD